MARDDANADRTRSTSPSGILALVLACGLASGLAGCSTPVEPAPSEPPATETAVETPEPCVEDPVAVADRPVGPATLNPLDTGIAAQLDGTVQDALADTAADGAVVGVRTPDGTWTAAFGLADPAFGIPMTVGTHTRLGSVTTAFTTTLLLQLEQQGVLALDDPVSTYVPGVPNGESITLRQLADGTSGLADYSRGTDLAAARDADPRTVFTPQQLLDAAFAEPSVAAPGAEATGSPTDAVLLGVVLEAATGTDVGTLYGTGILGPLGLEQTSWPGDSPELPAPDASGATWQGDAATPESPSDATSWNPSWAFASGALVGEIGDLLDWGRAAGTGQGVLDRDHAIARLAFPDGDAQALGLTCMDGWIGADGSIAGYSTSVYYDTTTDTTVAVQTNTDLGTGDCTEIGAPLENDADLPCRTAAMRIFVALSETMGHEFVPLAEQGTSETP
ncbi:serine hydrolase domain-containing protein [Agromyces seonyuensis]|uniref:Serine hydrolase n=1 Tax=Agromyces seonyuensis TaxID=2662446 RepID=A0A6I4P428_9MICO|nr:serine hydrolase domain-containing protein [Agromyces seonyuensis]MWB98157.1 serine hydrolase [Agromyces seonyuensis]